MIQRSAQAGCSVRIKAHCIMTQLVVSRKQHDEVSKLEASASAQEATKVTASLAGKDALLRQALTFTPYNEIARQDVRVERQTPQRCGSPWINLECYLQYTRHQTARSVPASHCRTFTEAYVTSRGLQEAHLPGLVVRAKKGLGGAASQSAGLGRLLWEAQIDPY